MNRMKEIQKKTSNADLLQPKYWYQKNVPQWLAWILITAPIIFFIVIPINEATLIFVFLRAKNFITKYPIIISFVTAEMSLLLLSHKKDIMILAKNKKQRTKKENLRVTHGLSRAIIVEFFLFVPFSVILFRVILFPFLKAKALSICQELDIGFNIIYALMGICSYGFPFEIIHKAIVKIAKTAIEEFILPGK